MPTKRSVDFIKSNILRPALTSHFEVEVPIPGGDFNRFLENNGVSINPITQEKLNILCSEATLPGSNLATLELTNDFHGVTERHAYRRVYDDRIDLTFYVDEENYLPIRFFEVWMKYIVDESTALLESKGTRSLDNNYFYRMRYPEGNNGYTSSGLKVIKFEREYRLKPLEYTFVKAFPISITSMPISYDASSLLKCTVSMTYIRYVLNTGETSTNKEGGTTGATGTSGLNITPNQQANINRNALAGANTSSINNLAIRGATGTGTGGNLGLSNLSATSSIGGGSQAAAKASGNTVSLSSLSKQVNEQGLAQAVASRLGRSATARPQTGQPPFR